MENVIFLLKEITKRGLLGVSIAPEDLGGDVQCIPISALKVNCAVCKQLIPENVVDIIGRI